MKKRKELTISTTPQEIKFKKVGEELFIEDIIQYIIEKVSYDPGTYPICDADGNVLQPGNSSNIKISVGCDSDDKGKYTEYVITIVFYNDWKRNGAHIVYKRLKVPKTMVILGKKLNQWVKEPIDPEYLKKIPTNLQLFTYNRLMNEGHYIMELAKYLDERLARHYYIQHKPNEYDGSKPYRLIEVHLDFNPKEGEGRKNKSNDAYHSFMGEFCAEGFKVVSKPSGNAYASSCAADFIISK